MESLLGYVLSCKHCSNVFVICKSCYRGHKYCSKACRKSGYEASRKQAREKYNDSIEAKLDHQDRSRRYRLSLQKSVTDKTSKVEVNTINKHLHRENENSLLKIKDQSGVCTSCGKLVFEEGVHIYGGSV